ncbi:MAG: cyclic nucleotide-binding domain-containing protein, partial [Flavobacteriales bacterium]|nr:cyclic nucleotide-binding domain-containing protein [Flavobacteriales bacterium]
MATETKLWHLENFNVFEGMSKAEMEMVDKMSRMTKTDNDQFIYFPDDPSTTIYFLKKGSVQIGATSDSGQESIKAILKPGELFGELTLTDEGVRSEYAKAIGG